MLQLRVGFYVCCPDGEGWPKPSITSLFLFDVFPHFSVGEKDSNDRAFGFAVVTCSDRDLFDEYVACEIWLLGHGWSIGPVTSRDFTGFDKPILCPTYVVELGDCSRDTFVVETEKEAEERVGQSMKVTYIVTQRPRSFESRIQPDERESH